VFQTAVDRIRLFFRKEKEPFLQLHKMLGFYPHNISLYREALLHKSYTKYRNEKSNLNNERLEFLGDAVLSAVVADILYEHYDNKQEGFLTTLRSKLVKRETLNKLAEQIGLDKFIQHIGPVTSAHNSYMGGNAFEALLGAIYLDRGYNYCIKFMQEQVFKHYIDMEKVAATEENFKSRLIEWCQKYQLKFVFDTKNSSENNGHTPVFKSNILIENVDCGSGRGYSKKESQQKAAREAMRKIRKDMAFVNTLIDAKKQRRENEKAQAEEKAQAKAEKKGE
jgi:ribonuclease-3